MELDKLRLILPQIRVRHGDSTWYSTTTLALLCIGLTVLIILYIVHRYKLSKTRKENFHQRCRELKLNRSKALLLYKIARKSKMKSPMALFSSLYIFDQQVGIYADKIVRINEAHPHLKILARIRDKLNLPRPSSNLQIASTRAITPGQILNLSIANAPTKAASSWMVIDIHAGALIITPSISTEPQKQKSARLKTWLPKQHLQVKFWDNSGLEYTFKTVVLYRTKDKRQLTLAHTNELQCIQHRNHLRLKVDFPLTIFGIPANSDQDLFQTLANSLAIHTSSQETPSSSLNTELQDAYPISVENLPPINVQVIDISAGGLALSSKTEIPDMKNFLIDPNASISAPLEGILCQEVRRYESPEGFHLNLEFVDLPPVTEKELVRLVNQGHITISPPAEEGNTS